MKARTHQVLTVTPRIDGAKRRVLYAEDQLTSRTVTTAMLERMGFAVHAVEDGEMALNAARNDNYDVILLDIEMPVMDGVSAARSIRAEAKHCATTPILALSAFLADSTEHTHWRDAFDDAVPKPANSNELFRALNLAVAEHDERVRVSAKPTRQELVAALKASLPVGVWRQISKAVCDEMLQLVNVMGAAAEAEDDATLAICATRLRAQAASFGASKVEALVDTGDLAALRRAALDWSRN